MRLFRTRRRPIRSARRGRGRTNSANYEPVFLVVETAPPWTVRLAALKTASAVQLAMLDGRRGDAEWLIRGLDRAELEEVTRELAVRYVMTANRTGQRDTIRDLVAAAAMIQARQHGG